ncbi:hypothetical protein B566_EDAN016592 [Ephemera danica]|nr:hypothetical protein B566_EDAN016592 [Ephemera danica]
MKLLLLLFLSVAVLQVQSTAIWYNYRTTLLNDESKMRGVFNCIHGLSEECNDVELEVKDVYKSSYLNDCADSDCSLSYLRRDMIVDCRYEKILLR